MQIKLDKHALATLLVACALAISINAQSSDYDAEAETSMSGLSGLGGMSGLTALANGILPVVSGGEYQGEVDEASADGERASDNSDGSDGESADYDDSSNDSAASEEHPILSKFINLISGGRHKRSVNQIEAPVTAETKTLHRVKRHYKGWVPYVKTYVKTDKKAHFKWGVKAKVGKKYGK